MHFRSRSLVILFSAWLLSGVFEAPTAFAQTSADFSAGGGVRLGWDSRTCDSSIDGSIRYNSSTACAEFCDSNYWICPGQDYSEGVERIQFKISNQNVNPSVTLNSTPIEGNLLVAIATHRQDAFADSISGAGWQLRDGFDVYSGDTSARRGATVWTKTAGASEPTAIDATIADGSTRLLVQEFAATGGDLVFADSNYIINSESVSSPVSTGTATASAGPVLAVSWVGTRSALYSTEAWSLGDDNAVFIDSAGSIVGIGSTFYTQEGGGSMSNSFSWDDGGGKGVSAGILLFEVQ